MIDRIIGRCSICNGSVTLPTYFMSVVPPVPTCQSCGATAAAPVIPMVPMTATGRKAVSS